MPKRRKRKFRYTHLLIAYVCFIAVTLFSLTPLLPKLTDYLSVMGLVGVFIGGALYVSAFTFSAGLLTLLLLAPSYNIFLVVLVASLGSLLSDYLIFRFVRDNLSKELLDIYMRFGGKQISKVLRLKAFSWIIPFVGAIIIASPLPDEIGVSLMGISKMKTLRFTITVFLLDVISIFMVVAFSDLITRQIM